MDRFLDMLFRFPIYEKDVTPLSLINGEKLTDLLSQYEIGINKKRFTYFTVDDSYFNTNEHEEE